MNTATNTIPVVILNWNGLNDTLECIAALEKQTYQDFTIWLVDNGSETPEVEKLKTAYSNHPKVRLVFNERNLGFTAGNNQILDDWRNGRKEERRNGGKAEAEEIPGREAKAEAKAEEIRNPKSEIRSPKSEIRNPQSIARSQKLAASSQNYIALLNNDTVPSPQWLEELVSTALSEQADMVSSKMVFYSEPDRIDNVGHVLLNTLEVLPLGFDAPSEQYTTVTENAGACGGAALYSVNMLRETGIFDERFTNGYEDVELGLRAILCGYKSVYAPGAVVLHKGSRAINRIRDFDYTLGIQRHIYYIQGKLFPWPVILLCLPFMAFRFFAALVINLLAFRWKFLRIQLQAVYHLFFTDLRAILAARRNFFREHKVISSWKILGKMTFFWRFDWERFKKYILRRERMVFEKY